MALEPSDPRERGHRRRECNDQEQVRATSGQCENVLVLPRAHSAPCILSVSSANLPLEQIRCGVDGTAPRGQDLEVQVGRRGVARVAHDADSLKGLHPVTASNGEGPQMRVAGAITVLVLKEDRAPVAPAGPDLDDAARPGGVDDIPTTLRFPEVDPRVQMPVPPAERGKYLRRLQRGEEARGGKRFSASRAGRNPGTRPGAQASRQEATPNEHDHEGPTPEKRK